jgi:tetratricopeptide (TPR) repeat protein
MRKNYFVSLLLTLFLLTNVKIIAQDDYIFIGGYFGKASPEKVCKYYQENSFITNEHAERVTDRILKPVGLPRNFVLFHCPHIDNAVAITFREDGVRYILYDNAFMEKLDNDHSDWSNLTILAHEIGHHLCGHTLLTKKIDLETRRKMELEADEFAGFVLYKLGATLKQAQKVINDFVPEIDDSWSTHPTKSKRLKAIEKGYNNAKTEDKPINIQSSESAESYFSKGYDLYNNKKNYIGAIEAYTSAITLNPKYTYAYNNRGVAKDDLKDYQGAIEDYNKAINIDPNYANAYYNRGIAKKALNNYQGAIEDYNKAINIDPNYAEAYNNRGIAKKALNNYQGAIEDYSTAIKINPSHANAYYNRGIAKRNLKDYQGAIEDYNKAIEINPNHSNAFYNRGLAKYYGNFSGYCDDFKKALQLGDSDAQALIDKYCK